MLLLMLLLPLLLGAHIVVGEAAIDGTSTLISRVDDDEKTALCTLEHRKGYLPKGALHASPAGDTLVVTVATHSDREASVLTVDLQSCAVKELVDQVIATQAPVIVEEAGVSFAVAVRQLDASAAGASFDVVAVPLQGGPIEVLAARDALWVTPAQGARTFAELRFLVGEGAGARDGEWHLDRIDHGGFVALRELGPGAFRSPVVVDGALLIESSDRDGKRAALIDADGKERARGIAGLSPVARDKRLAVSTGKKDGSVSVDGVVWHSKRAGIAKPLALSNDVVIAWLDRGASLPGELWSISSSKSRLLLPPRERSAVAVYDEAPKVRPGGFAEGEPLECRLPEQCGVME